MTTNEAATKPDENRNKNRGYYSEKTTRVGKVFEEVPENLQHLNVAVICPMHSWRIQTENYAPIVHRLPTVRRERYLEPAQKWIRYPGKMSIAFPVQTIKPKVQLIHDTKPGQLPREVEVDRRRRKYAKMNIQELLLEKGIESYKLIPVHVLESMLPIMEKLPGIFNRCCLFPLEWFDNLDFDSMTSQEWLHLGYVDGVRHPIPGEAFLPNPFLQENPKRKTLWEVYKGVDMDMANAFGMPSDRSKLKNHLYMWTKVAVKNYDPIADKWIVTDLATMKSYKISRIYLMFTAENPEDFAKRIQYAVDYREKCEKMLKFETIVDCLQLTGLPPPPVRLEERIHQMVQTILHDSNKQELDDLDLQIGIIYRRVQASLDFKKNILRHPEEFSFAEAPERVCMIYRDAIQTIGKERFKELQQLLKQNSIFYISQSINAMHNVVSECLAIEKHFLFNLSAGKSSSLKDFVSTQQYTCSTVSKYLKGFWLENMTGQICMRLRGVGKGWLDLTIHDWGVYRVSKIYRFLNQVRYRMQDALHCFLERSITGYIKFLCEPCEVINDIDESFEWTFSLNFSPFTPKTPHIFYMILSITETGGKYSTDPDEFRPAILGILEEALLQCCGIFQIDPNVMSALVFRNDLYLKSTVLVEDLIESSRNKIIEMYDVAIVPLKAYARRFDEFIPLHLLNVNDHVKEFFATERTPYEVKNEIAMQMQLREKLEIELPKSIVIGPFLINVEGMKQLFIAKRRDIVKKELETYTVILHKKTETLIDQFQQIMMKISEKTSSIEHVYAIRDFAKNVPEKLDDLSERLRLLLLEFDVLDYFWHNLSNEDFALKWEAIGWPYQIMKFLEELPDQQETEIEEFHRLQINDQINFTDRVDSMNEEILKYSRMFDHTKAWENAADIKKTWKLVGELKKQGEILQQRQIIFEMSEMNFTNLDDITNIIGRYKNLWFACADFLKYEEISFGNNLINVDVAELKSVMEGIKESLTASLEYFSDKPEIIAVVEHYLDQVEKFRPALIIIECVRSPHWSIVHWQELAKRAGLDMKFSISINFRYCVNKGILDHVELVQEIWERSKDEADIVAKVVAEEEQRLQEEADALLERKKNRKGRTDI